MKNTNLNLAAFGLLALLGLFGASNVSSTTNLWSVAVNGVCEDIHDTSDAQVVCNKIVK